MDAASGRNGPQVLPLPMAIAATGTRAERDSPGGVVVPAGPYGAQAHLRSGPGQPGADPGRGSGPAGQA